MATKRDTFFEEGESIHENMEHQIQILITHLPGWGKDFDNIRLKVELAEMDVRLQ